MSTLSLGASVDLTFFPDWRAANPYQGVLYRAIGPTVRARPGLFDAAGADRVAATGAAPVFHLHWEEAIVTDAGLTPERFLDALAQFRANGGRIVWTVHNLDPHDPARRSISRDLRPGLLELADAIHVHSTHALAALAGAWGTIPRQTRIIPHPNYAGWYPVLDRQAARVDLGLQDARMVILAPGRLAPYKRTNALIEAFVRVAGPDDVLLVAGALAKGHEIAVPPDSRVRVVTDFASAEQFARLHAACNLVVLPYAASLTSGSAILAATLGRGVLGADTPGLRDAVADGHTGVLCDLPDDATLVATLAAALHAALDEGTEIWAARGKHAALAAEGRDRTVIGTMWRDLLLALPATRVDIRRRRTPE
jgi:glycosyltransferase involved in cell wall biosynthesis